MGFPTVGVGFSAVGAALCAVGTDLPAVGAGLSAVGAGLSALAVGWPATGVEMPGSDAVGTGVDVDRGFIGSVGGIFMYVSTCSATFLKIGEATCPPYILSAPSSLTRMINLGSLTGPNPTCDA